MGLCLYVDLCFHASSLLHRNLSWGVPRQRFLQQNWELKLERGEFDTPVEMARHIQALEEEVTLLSNTKDEIPCLHAFWHAIPTSFYIFNVLVSILFSC